MCWVVFFVGLKWKAFIPVVSPGVDEVRTNRNCIQIHKWEPLPRYVEIRRVFKGTNGERPISRFPDFYRAKYLPVTVSRGFVPPEKLLLPNRESERVPLFG